MKPPPFPKCSTHGVHHTPGKDCKVSEEDQARIKQYEEEVETAKASWAPIQSTPNCNYSTDTLLKSIALREKIRLQERKRLEQENHHPEGN